MPHHLKKAHASVQGHHAKVKTVLSRAHGLLLKVEKSRALKKVHAILNHKKSV